MLLPATDRKTADAASELIAGFGASAAPEAAARAAESRNRGNTIRFCHWRQVERMIALLADDRATGTIH